MTAKLHSSGNSSNGVHPWTQNVGLKKLCTLLRSEGDRVLSGRSAFTLTTEVLTRLNHDCRRHSITESDIAVAEISSGGRSFLTLANRLRTQQAAARAKEEWIDHVQFIKDFMLSTPSLKLIHYSGTLSSPISLHRFGNLTCLQLRKVPIHMVEGLHRLRGVLVSVTVYRSLDKVKDLLEFCGGDMTAPMVWPQLKYVSFMFNSISALDDSLRLLTHVEVLDLSHNSLETCDRFLEYLGDVHQITLAYNFLTCVPPVSATARTYLSHLVLRGNNLDDIKGIEVLTSLLQLDLGENCISDHSRLDSLTSLIRLKQLQLDGNPVFYHKQHRLLTVACLALTAVSVEFELDKKRLTSAEISKAEVKRSRTSHLSYVRDVTARSHTPDSGYYVSASSDIGTENESVNSAVTYTSKKKGKRKRLKARHMDISDVEHSEDMSSSRDVTPGTSPHPQRLEQQVRARREEAIHTQREVEELRKHYGSNWLQAIEDRDIFNKKKATQVAVRIESSDLENTESDNSSGAKFIIGSKNSSGSEKKFDTMIETDKLSISGEEVVPTDDDLYLTDTGIRDAHNPIMAAIARLAAGHSSDSTDEGNKSGTAFHSFQNHAEYNSESKLGHSFMDEITNCSRYTSTNIPSCSEFKVSGNVDAKVTGKNDLLTDLHKTVHDDSCRSISPTNIPQASGRLTENTVSLLSKCAELKTGVRSQNEAVAAKTIRELNTSPAGKAKLSLYNTQTSSPVSPDLVEKEEEEEEEEMIEPVFATLPLQANEMIILTLTASFLVEKNIQGKVTEKLELASLTGMDWRKVIRPHSQSETGGGVTGPGDDSEKFSKGEVGEMAESIQLDLKFDYMRKDRQSRCYIVDCTDGNVILAYLQPFIESREGREKAKSMVPMQCLKCNRSFPKSELIQQKSQLPTSGSSKDLKSIQELMNKTTMLCPKCGSSLIIELQHSPSTVRSTGSATSTPVGSYASLSGSYMDQVKRPSSLARKKSLDMTTSVRDRTSAVVTDTYSLDCTIAERDEIVCIENHFSASNMTNIPTSSHFSHMTTSLQGDLSTRGKNASVKRTPLKETHSIDSAESKVAEGIQKHLIDSGYESGILNSSGTFSRPVAIERRCSSHESEGCGEKDADKVISESRSLVHTNLAAMEEMVNSLVREGKCLEEEGFSSSSYSSSKGKSISISAFMKSSHGHNRKTSIVSIEGGNIYSGLKHSESSSSIAVIPVPTSGSSFDALSVIPPLSSSLPPEGTHMDPEMFAADSDRSASTISPLSSNICSSMVSSIYETSVNTPGGENDAGSHAEGTDAGPDVSTDGIQTITSTAVIMIGSSCSSSEDLTSIYDHRREPNFSSIKKSHSKHKVTSFQPKTTSEVDGHQEGSTLCVTEMLGDSQGGSATGTLMLTNLDISQNLVSVANSAVEEDDDDDTDKEDEEDLVPQYAFHHLNHRLTLYMMMSLFGTDEEFVCKLQGEIVQYIVEKSYQGLLVMTSARFYILKITSEDHSQPPDHWLHCVEIQPIPELRYIGVGLGGQTFRLEFVTDCSSYTFITRNRDKTVQFVELLHTNLAKYAVSQGIASHVVVSDDIDETTLNNLDRDVVSKLAPDQKMLLYCMGFIERGNQKLFPISFVITTSDVCLVCTNLQWPQPRLQAAISEETIGKQFMVLERQKVSNVAAVEVCETTMKKIRLELFNETEGTSTSWNITLASKQSTVDFINALSQPWAKEFGVEMDVGYADLPF